MTLISDSTPLWVQPPPPTAVPTIVVGGGGCVVALRHRPVVAMGGLVDRTESSSDRLVAARDMPGHSWWIPADAVWSDATSPHQPQHPRPVGLATARSREHAVLAGLSDRLGWEAVIEHERGGRLPVLDGLIDSDEFIILDGRLGHDVPTVVVIGRDMTRWGAGATWASAVHRALYGDDGGDSGESDELEALVESLERRGLSVVAVDLATPLISRVGVVRFSIQLLIPNDGSGRTWDAVRVQ